MPKENTAASRMAMPLGSFGGGVGNRARIRRQGMCVTELYLRRKRFLEQSGIVLETDGKPVGETMARPGQKSANLSTSRQQARGFIPRVPAAKLRS